MQPTDQLPVEFFSICHYNLTTAVDDFWIQVYGIKGRSLPHTHKKMLHKHENLTAYKPKTGVLMVFVWRGESPLSTFFSEVFSSTP